MKQEKYVKIKEYGTLLSLPTPQGIRRDLYVCITTIDGHGLVYSPTVASIRSLHLSVILNIHVYRSGCQTFCGAPSDTRSCEVYRLMCYFVSGVA